MYIREGKSNKEPALWQFIVKGGSQPNKCLQQREIRVIMERSPENCGTVKDGTCADGKLKKSFWRRCYLQRVLRDEQKFITKKEGEANFRHEDQNTPSTRDTMERWVYLTTANTHFKFLDLEVSFNRMQHNHEREEAALLEPRVSQAKWLEVQALELVITSGHHLTAPLTSCVLLLSFSLPNFLPIECK